MTSLPIKEWTDYEAPDGTVYPLLVPSRIGRWVLSQQGWGTPPIEFVTQRGPFQHGETVKAYYLRPRIIQMLIRQEFCNRNGYWNGRAAILDAIRTNRQSSPTAALPGHLRRRLPDGSQRQLDVFISEGPQFSPATGVWDEFAFQEVLRFIAFDPVVYDPTRVDVDFALATADAHLVFPITFPIQFRTAFLNVTKDIPYAGTWESLPVIVITGPINIPSITNLDTGEVITLNYNVPAGVVVTIDLSYGAKTVVDSLGNNLLGVVDPSSDLGSWHIAPDPEAPLGVNTIEVTGGAATGATNVEIQYYTRYFGI